MRRCSSCTMIKHIDCFYAHPAGSQGALNKCKECHKRLVRINRAIKWHYYSQYERWRNQLPHRVAERLIYARTPDGKEARRRACTRYGQKYPEKRAAHIKAGNAIRDGRLIRQPCESCGSKDVEAHHKDYSKPLDVTWLCKRCHMQVHWGEVMPGGDDDIQST